MSCPCREIHPGRPPDSIDANATCGPAGEIHAYPANADSGHRRGMRQRDITMKIFQAAIRCELSPTRRPSGSRPNTKAEFDAKQGIVARLMSCNVLDLKCSNASAYWHGEAAPRNRPNSITHRDVVDRFTRTGHWFLLSNANRPYGLAVRAGR